MTKSILAIFVVFGLLVALYFAYNNIVKERFTEKISVRVCLFYAEWCPYCVKYMKTGIFDKVSQEMKNDTKNQDVTFEKIDYEQNKNLAQKYDVNGFPTIVSLDAKGNKLREFQGDRNDPAELKAFAIESVAQIKEAEEKAKKQRELKANAASI